MLAICVTRRVLKDGRLLDQQEKGLSVQTLPKLKVDVTGKP